MKWELKDKSPITTEGRQIVVNENGDEGIIEFRWSKALQVFKKNGPVFVEKKFFDLDGVEDVEPRTFVLDQNPLIVAELPAAHPDMVAE